MRSLGCLFLLIALVALFAAIVKNDSASGIAFIIAFILGVVGLVCMAAARPDASATEKRELSAGKSKKCPYCAETVKAEATVCRFCGRDLGSPQMSLAATQPALTAKQPREVSTSAKFSLSPSENEPTQDRKVFLWLQEEQSGPYAINQIRTMLAQSVIVAETLIWEESMAEWLPLTDTDILGDKRQRIAFVCPRCTEKLEATGNQSGTAINCPMCQHHLTIPNRITSKSSDANTRGNQIKQTNKNHLYILAGFIAATLILAIIVLNSRQQLNSIDQILKQEDTAGNQRENQQKQLSNQKFAAEHPDIQQYFNNLKESVKKLQSDKSSLEFTLNNSSAMLDDMFADGLRKAKDRIKTDLPNLRIIPPLCIKSSFLTKLKELQDAASSLDTELSYIFAVRASQHDLGIAMRSINESCSKLDRTADAVSSELNRDVVELVDSKRLDTILNNTVPAVTTATPALVDSASLPSLTSSYNAMEDDLLLKVENSVLSNSTREENEEAQRQLAARIESLGGLDSLKQAANAGIVPAIGILGCLHHFGSGVPQDDKQASIYLREAAEKGDKLSMLLLGTFYMLGAGVPQDDGQAIILFKEAAEKGEKLAAFLVAARYASGGTNLTSNLTESLMWAEKAQSAGVPQAANLVVAVKKALADQEVAALKIVELQRQNEQAQLASDAKNRETEQSEQVAREEVAKSAAARKPKYYTIYNKRSVDVHLKNGLITIRKGTTFETLYPIDTIDNGIINAIPTWVDRNRIDTNPAYPRKYMDQKFDPIIQAEIPSGIELPGMYFSSDESFRSK